MSQPIAASYLSMIPFYQRWRPDGMAEYVERSSPVWRDRGFESAVSNSGWVKFMTYKLNRCRFLARCSALLGKGEDCLAQCQDNVIEWDISSWWWWHGLPVKNPYTVTTSTHCDKTPQPPTRVGATWRQVFHCTQIVNCNLPNAACGWHHYQNIRWLVKEKKSLTKNKKKRNLIRHNEWISTVSLYAMYIGRDKLTPEWE